MKYFEYDEGNYIIAVGKGAGPKEISKTRYNQIMRCLRSKPEDTEEYIYMLTVGLEWVAVPVEKEDDPNVSDL